jgi:hypothetical protein
VCKRSVAAFLIAVFAATCAAPAPAPTPSPELTPSPSPSASSAATTSPPPTSTPEPTAAPTLRIQDIDVFEGGAANWELATTETNVDGITHVVVLRAITDTIDIYADCVGDGSLAVSVNAGPPPESPPPAVPPSPYTMTTFELDCPDAQMVSFGGAAPAGWFISTDGTPSDPSIRYQILVAAAKS